MDKNALAGGSPFKIHQASDGGGPTQKASHHVLRISRVIERRRLAAPALDLPLRMLAGPLRDDRLRRHCAVLGGKIFPRGTSLRKAFHAYDYHQRRR